MCLHLREVTYLADLFWTVIARMDTPKYGETLPDTYSKQVQADKQHPPSLLFQKVTFWRPLTVKWSPSPDFRQNFGCQKFFPLAMATKMVAA